jgi:phage regulator Rha-like protein
MTHLHLIPSAPISMTSREIAELTGRLHKNVLRDIDNLLMTLGSELSFGFKSSTYAAGDPPREYRQFELDRDSTYCLVAGYDAEARMRIIKRWQALEAGAAAPKITDPTLAALVHGLMEIDHLKQQNALLLNQQTAINRKAELLESRVEHVELQHRNGVPAEHLSKKHAHHLYGEGLSEEVFHLAMAKLEVPIKNYIHRGEDGYEVATYAYLEDKIQDAVDMLIADAKQVTPQMCQSTLLGGKRFRYMKDSIESSVTA